MGTKSRTANRSGTRVAAYRVRWSDEDQEWVATVEDLPSLSWLAPTPTAALAGLLRVEREARADLEASLGQVLKRIRRGTAERGPLRVPAAAIIRKQTARRTRRPK
jgi:hypothetical protein